MILCNTLQKYVQKTAWARVVNFSSKIWTSLFLWNIFTGAEKGKHMQPVFGIYFYIPTTLIYFLFMIYFRTADIFRPYNLPSIIIDKP